MFRHPRTTVTAPYLDPGSLRPLCWPCWPGPEVPESHLPMLCFLDYVQEAVGHGETVTHFLSFLLKSVCVSEKLLSENVNIAGICTSINGILFLVVHCLSTETHKLPPQAQLDHTQTRRPSRLCRVWRARVSSRECSKPSARRSPRGAAAV